MGIRKRLIFAVGSLLVLINIAFWSFYFIARGRVESDLQTKLEGLSRVLASETRGELVATLRVGKESSRTYRNLLSRIEVARDAFRLERVMIVDLDGRMRVDSNEQVAIGDRVYILEGMAEQMREAKHDSASTTVVYHGDDGRPYKSAFSPIHSRTGAVVGVLVVEASAAFLQQVGFFHRVVVAVSLTSVLALALLAVVLSVWAVNPVLRLAGASAQIRDGTYASVPPTGVRELRTLAESFNEMAASIRDKEDRLRELARREAQRASETERYAEHILASIANGIVSVDRDGIIRVCNAEACRLLGVRADEVLACHVESVPELAPVATPLMRAMRTDNVTRDRQITIESKRGEHFDVNLSASSLPDVAGTGIAATAVITDQTHILKLQNEIKHKETLAVIGELAAHVAHEIRNPLGSMSIFMDLLGREGTDETQRAEYTARVSGEIRRLNGIVTRFLQYAGPDRLITSEFDLVQMLRDAVALAQREAGARCGGNFATHAPVRVNADRDQLLQSFLNLIINAHDAAQQSGSISVDVNVADEREVEVRIVDTGAGIAPEHLPNVFQPFFSTKSQGTGLGLAMVRRVIENHDGSIHIQSAPGAGTTVTVTLSSLHLSDDAL